MWVFYILSKTKTKRLRVGPLRVIRNVKYSCENGKEAAKGQSGVM